MGLILGIDTSATPVSCGVIRDGKVLASFYSHTGLTHSQTLMTMVENTLSVANVGVGDLDALAVNVGPGSFTGVRIGVSAVKGLAFAQNIPCVGVSTLEAMAESFAGAPVTGDVVCVMDARCQQVYTATFALDDEGKLTRLTEDEAISLEELKKRRKICKKNTIFVGDGAEMCYNRFLEDRIPASLASVSVRYQNAVGTALVAERLLAEGKAVDAEALLPAYLRLPQAERELKARQAQSGEKK